ncbi:RICIN domain-containing protein [Streptomyces sp. NPDC091385]|uniref:RICIN domain-containing protein n=1 Tax=Streptomyces sp. NPDC091385 TaxID=3365997 RepID=UPI0038115912
MGIDGASTAAGAAAILANGSGDANQDWALTWCTDYVFEMNRKGGLCLGISSASTANGATAAQFKGSRVTCHGAVRAVSRAAPSASSGPARAPALPAHRTWSACLLNRVGSRHVPVAAGGGVLPRLLPGNGRRTQVCCSLHCHRSSSRKRRSGHAVPRERVERFHWIRAVRSAGPSV